jgi:hypothetical protein
MHQKGHQLSSGKIVSGSNYIHEDGYDPVNDKKFVRAVSEEYERLRANLITGQAQRGSDGEEQTDLDNSEEKRFNRSDAAKIHREILGRKSYLQMWNRAKDTVDPGMSI